MSLDFSDNPFVGLRPFETSESLLFFGRQTQTMEILQRLHQYHFVSIIGSSGSGKSSLIKAGVIPRLKAGYLVRVNDHWIIATMKPGQSPIGNLLSTILEQSENTSNGLTSTDLQQNLKEYGVDAILKVIKSSLKSNSSFLLVVDQFEELFRFTIDKKDFIKTDEAIDFVNILLELSKQTALPVYVVITMRSDFIGDCAQFHGLPEVMNQCQYIVPRLNRIQLENIIEGPVRLYSGNIHPALTARLLNDVQLVHDELPLLQHALMRIWNYEKITDKNGQLDLGDYKRIGGIEKALSNHADEALEGMSETEKALTKKLFQALTGIDENGRKIRRPARLSELQALTNTHKGTLLSIINRFIEGNKSFLVINKLANENDLLIDISHESLIRQWSILNAWVDEEAEAGKMFLRLSESFRLYHEKKKDLLTGNELHQFLQWYYSFQPDKIWAQRYDVNFEENIQYLKDSEKQEKEQRAIKRRNRRLLIAGLVFVIIIISSFAYSIYRNDIRNKKALALNYWKSSQVAKAENNSLDGLHLLADAIAASNDKELIQKFLIDAEALLPRVSLKNIFSQNNIINSVAFNANGDRILIGSNDGTARIINKITGVQIGPSMSNQWPVINAIFSPDDKMILTSGNGKAVRIWDAATGQQIHLFRFNEDVKSAVFSPDGKFVLTSSANDSAQIWEIATEKMLYALAHESDVLTGVFSPDGGKILTTTDDETVHLWDLATKKEIPFPGPAENNTGIKNAIFSPDGIKILTICTDSAIRIQDLMGNPIALFKHNDRVNDATFSSDSRLIITASSDKSARLWDIQNQKQIGTSLKHEGPVYSVSFSHDGKEILSGGWDKTIRLWNIETSVTENNILASMNGKVTNTILSRDGTKVLVVSMDSTANIWDLVSRKQIVSLKHETAVNNAVFDPDNTKVLTTCDDSSIRIWETATGKQTGSLKFEEDVSYSAFNGNGKLILTVTGNNHINIWDAALASAAKPVHTFTYPDIHYAVFSPDGKTILIAAGDNAAHLLDANTGNPIISFKHDNMVSNAVYSADGNRILTASYDYTARLWNAVTGQQIGPSMKHSNYVNSANFSPNRKWIITASWDNEAHLWDAVTLKEIGMAKKHEGAGAVTSAVFSSDSKWIITGGYDSTVRLWEISGDQDMPASLFKLQAKATTGMMYNLETSETTCITATEWAALKEEYDDRGRKHYKKCKYPQHNLWRKFNYDEAEKIRPGMQKKF
jgi:WD40 repeat protein